MRPKSIVVNLNRPKDGVLEAVRDLDCTPKLAVIYSTSSGVINQVFPSKSSILDIALVLKKKKLFSM